MKLAAFDLETAKILPEEVDDIKKYAPLGISCAAVALSDSDDVEIWQGSPKMTVEECQKIVERLQALVADGYRIVTWNGASFDFFVLGQESNMYEECGTLALDHTDLMAIVTFTKGYFLSLDKALGGAGLDGKVKNLVLNDGSELVDMSGAKAPKLWKAGEFEAVIKYLKADVEQLVKLAQFVERTKAINWLSNKGNAAAATVKKFYSVRECFKIKKPNTSWMDNAPTREGFVDWIPNWKKKLNLTNKKSRNNSKNTIQAPPKSSSSKEIKPSCWRKWGRIMFIILGIFIVLTICLALVGSILG